MSQSLEEDFRFDRWNICERSAGGQATRPTLVGLELGSQSQLVSLECQASLGRNEASSLVLVEVGSAPEKCEAGAQGRGRDPGEPEELNRWSLPCRAGSEADRTAMANGGLYLWPCPCPRPRIGQC